MTKIDKEFFEDYYKFDKNKKSSSNIANFQINSNENKELIYEFAIYHPFKNTKTQQVSLAGSCYMYDLKDKIYCVLDEIHQNSNNQSSFFFVENTFYNDTRNENKTLSSKISENKIRKLNISSFSNYHEENLNCNSKMVMEDCKFHYDKFLYSSCNFSPSELYEEISMNDLKVNEINFRIGYPYLYRHIEYCDHMIMLLDIRLSDVYDKLIDEQSKSFVTYQKKLKRRICDGCLFYYAKFISINDKIAGDTGETNKVLFYCEFCLKKLHEREIKENTLGSLKLIPYYHD